MNNATYFHGDGGRLSLNDAYVKWCRITNNSETNMNYMNILKFAQSPAMEVLQFDVGQIVQFDFNCLKDLYGVIESYHHCALSLDCGMDAWCVHTLYVKAQNGTSYQIQNCGRKIRQPEFPQGLVELVRNQLQTSCPANIKEKCPFKDEYKEPVPPCMKE